VIISTSNLLRTVTPVILAAASADDPLAITSPDYSFNYTSSNAAANFEISFGVTSTIDHVAISGHNAATLGAFNIVILDNGITVLTTPSFTTNRDLMISISPAQTFVDLQVRFITTPTTFTTTVSFIAAGISFVVPNDGEQAGFNRSWLGRQLTERVTTTINAAPVAVLKRRKPLRGTLNIPNALTTFSQDTWQDFFDFILREPFFIKEIDTQSDTSYVCFEPTLTTPKAHGQTRALDNLNLRFLAFNGL